MFSLCPWSGWIHADLPGFRVTRERSSPSRRSFAYRTITLFGQTFQSVRLNFRFVTRRPGWTPTQLPPTTPNRQRIQAITSVRFRLFPVRSPLLGESRCFLFLRVLRWFNSPGSPSCPMYSDRNLKGLPSGVAPFGNPRIKVC